MEGAYKQHSCHLLGGTRSQCRHGDVRQPVAMATKVQIPQDVQKTLYNGVHYQIYLYILIYFVLVLKKKNIAYCC